LRQNLRRDCALIHLTFTGVRDDAYGYFRALPGLKVARRSTQAPDASQSLKAVWRVQLKNISRVRDERYSIFANGTGGLIARGRDPTVDSVEGRQQGSARSAYTYRLRRTAAVGRSL